MNGCTAFWLFLRAPGPFSCYLLSPPSKKNKAMDPRRRAASSCHVVGDSEQGGPGGRAGGRGGPGARAGLGPVLPRSDTLSFPICSGTISRVPSGGTKMLLGGRGGGCWEWGWEGSTSPVTLTQAHLAPGPQQSRLHYCSIIF